MKDKIYIFQFTHGGEGPAPCVGAVTRAVHKVKLRTLHHYANCSVFLGQYHTVPVAKIGTFRRTICRYPGETFWRTYMPSFHHLPKDLDTTDTIA